MIQDRGDSKRNLKGEDSVEKSQTMTDDAPRRDEHDLLGGFDDDIDNASAPSEDPPKAETTMPENIDMNGFSSPAGNNILRAEESFLTALEDTTEDTPGTTGMSSPPADDSTPSQESQTSSSDRFESFNDDDENKPQNSEERVGDEASDEDFADFATPAAEQRVSGQDETEDHREEPALSEAVSKEKTEEGGLDFTMDDAASPAESNDEVVGETLPSPVALDEPTGTAPNDGFGDFAASETLDNTTQEENMVAEEISPSEEKITVNVDASQALQTTQQTEILMEQNDEFAVGEESSTDKEETEVLFVLDSSSIQKVEASTDESHETDVNDAELNEPMSTEPASLMKATGDDENEADDKNDNIQSETALGDPRNGQDIANVGSVNSVLSADQEDDVECFTPDIAPEVSGPHNEDSGEMVDQAPAQEEFSQEIPGRLPVEDKEMACAATSADDSGSKLFEGSTSVTAEAATDSVVGAAGDIDETSDDEDEFGAFGDFNEVSTATDDASSPAKGGDDVEEEDDEDFGDFTDFNEAPAATEQSDAVAYDHQEPSNPTDNGMKHEEEPTTPPESDNGFSDPVIARAAQLFSDIFADSIPDEVDECVNASRSCVTVEDVLTSLREDQPNTSQLCWPKHALHLLLANNEGLGEVGPKVIIHEDSSYPYDHFSVSDAVHYLQTKDTPPKRRMSLSTLMSDINPSPPANQEEREETSANSSGTEFNTSNSTGTVVSLPPTDESSSGLVARGKDLTAKSAASSTTRSESKTTVAKEFLQQIPDLSFMLKSTLSLPKDSSLN